MCFQPLFLHLIDIRWNSWGSALFIHQDKTFEYLELGEYYYFWHFIVQTINRWLNQSREKKEKKLQLKLQDFDIKYSVAC